MAILSTREKITNCADQLIHQQGFAATSFAQISTQLRISKGNLYYHFKTKDQILTAVIKLRLSNTHQQLKHWDLSHKASLSRLQSFINALDSEQHNIIHYGCATHQLISELKRLKHPAQQDATMLFTLLRTWLRRQFTLLGHQKNADQFALHLLAQCQGVIAVANMLNDPDFFSKQIQQLHLWLRTHRQPTEQHSNI